MSDPIIQDDNQSNQSDGDYQDCDTESAPHKRHRRSLMPFERIEILYDWYIHKIYMETIAKNR